MYIAEIKVLDKTIKIVSKEQIDELTLECIEVAYMAILKEYIKLEHIMNVENRVLEAKYYAIECLQNEAENEHESKTADLLSQYIINLDFGV